MTKLEGIIVNIIPTSTPPTLVQESAQQSLEVYPNPVSNILYLKDFDGERVGYSIFNVLGQEVTSGSTSGSIAVATLKKGIYLLQIQEENFRRTARFVVK